MGQRCILYYKHGWDTYLTRSADLCKHTSGCSANKSRLYCPLTSAELLIVNVTQLQRRASTVDWGSLSLTSWLTAANTPHLLQDTTHTHIHTDTTRHPRLNHKRGVCVCVGSSLCRRSVGSTGKRDFFHKKRTNMGGEQCGGRKPSDVYLKKISSENFCVCLSKFWLFSINMAV